ncbi:MAG: hypothetical protein IPG74_14395 [Flavobacteriales bacterium]|nr:hypothetical protein [Flavobacteriales bacterium]
MSIVLPNGAAHSPITDDFIDNNFTTGVVDIGNAVPFTASTGALQSQSPARPTIT